MTTRYFFAALLACGALVPSLASAQAVIEGTVRLPAAAASAAAPPRYAGQPEIAPPEPPVGVVYLEGDFPKGGGTNATADLWQKGAQFKPGVLAVQAGTTVLFPNSDEFYHNVFSYSKTKRFDLGRYRR